MGYIKGDISNVKFKPKPTVTMDIGPDICFIDHRKRLHVNRRHVIALILVIMALLSINIATLILFSASILVINQH